MKRDMDLIRAIALRIEAEPSGWAPDGLTIEGYSAEQVGYHTLLMIESGLAAGNDVSSQGDDSPSGLISRLTSAGHDFIEMSKEPTRWGHAKRIIEKIGGASMPALIEILTKMTVSAAGM